MKKEIIIKIPFLSSRLKILIYFGPIILGLFVSIFNAYTNEPDDVLFLIVAFTGLSIFVWTMVIIVSKFFPPMLFNGKSLIVKKNGKRIALSMNDVDYLIETHAGKGINILNIYTKEYGCFRFWVPAIVSECIVDDKVKLYKCLQKWYMSKINK